jgi:tRNA (guanine6-N2)-methyltransferase
LSAWSWRVEGHQAAANATLAAAMALLSGPRATDRVVNLMCGSGTLLIERLLAGPAQRAVGVDISQGDQGRRRQRRRSRVGGGVELLTEDIRGDGWLGLNLFDCLLADPPWGDKSGSHAKNEELHRILLKRKMAALAGVTCGRIGDHERTGPVVPTPSWLDSPQIDAS